MDRLTVTTHERKIELWINRIRECKASNQSVSDWCNVNQVSIKSYYYWMRKIKHEAFESLPEGRKSKVSSCVINTTFAEVPKLAATAQVSTAVLIRICNTTVEIQNGADPATVENTLRIIQRLC